MSPEQKIYWAAIVQSAEWAETEPPDLTVDQLDEYLMDLQGEDDDRWDNIQDALSEIREGDEVTDIPCEDSRHYESKSVAKKMPDGTWLGWTYWYGGGKHGEPDAIDWVDQAYELDVVEQRQMVTTRTFHKASVDH